jgi:hypothetical protein
MRELAAALAGEWFAALQAGELPKIEQPAPVPRSVLLIPYGCVRSRMDIRQPDHQAETSVVR